MVLADQDVDGSPSGVANQRVLQSAESLSIDGVDDGHTHRQGEERTRRALIL
jgi:hypothetical protein